MVDQKKIHEQSISNDPEERNKAVEQLEGNFTPHLSIQKTWEDYYLIILERTGMPCPELDDLASVFYYLPDKHHIYEDLQRLIDNESYDVRYRAIYALCSVFSQVPDKQQAWDDLHRQLNDDDRFLRCSAAGSFRFAFPYVPDKQQAWNDLRNLLCDEFWYVRDEAVKTLKCVYSYVPDKLTALSILVNLTSHSEELVRLRAASALDSVFALEPDKQILWDDLHRLSNDQDRNVRFHATYVLSSLFALMSDKQMASDDLHRLSNDQDTYVRSEVAKTLGSVFALVSDKQMASDDLHRLSNDQESYVRSEVAKVLGSVFAFVSDKQMASDDLHRLTSDREGYVSTYANYSLGKISIYKASQAETNEAYKEELENAIKFFEITTKEAHIYNPSKFCLPFYRSFHTILFKRKKENEEVDKYLAEAKTAIEGSKNKELLFEAVTNLANALKEVQCLDNAELLITQDELNYYRKYCERAADLMNDAEEIAPFAAMTMKRGLPIFNRNIKNLLKEIREKAKIACKESLDTPIHDAAFDVYKEVRKWEIGNQEKMNWQVERLISNLELIIPIKPENRIFLVRINQIREEKDIVKQYSMVSDIILLIPTLSMNERMDEGFKGLGNKIETMNTNLEKVNENNIIITEKLNELNELKSAVDRLTASIDQIPNPQEFLATMQSILEEIKTAIPELKGEIEEVLYELYEPMDTKQKLKITFTLIPKLVHYEIETNPPKLVADNIDKLKNLVWGFWSK